MKTYTTTENGKRPIGDKVDPTYTWVAPDLRWLTNARHDITWACKRFWAKRDIKDPGYKRIP